MKLDCDRFNQGELNALLAVLTCTRYHVTPCMTENEKRYLESARVKLALQRELLK